MKGLEQKAIYAYFIASMRHALQAQDTKLVAETSDLALQCMAQCLTTVIMLREGRAPIDDHLLAAHTVVNETRDHLLASVQQMITQFHQFIELRSQQNGNVPADGKATPGT